MSESLLIEAFTNHVSFDENVVVEPIKKGASGRTIVRLKASQGKPCIGIHYTLDRNDNALYEGVSRFLERGGVRVPKLLYSEQERHLLIVEDIGTTDLLSYKGGEWEKTRDVCRSVFEQLHRLSKLVPDATVPLMSAFEEESYRWEQEYFAEHFVQTHLGLEAELILNSPLMKGLASELGASCPNFLHRDFQSQNIMVRDKQAYLIDFQGARMGRVEYDLASFIYDPYMSYDSAQQEDLIELWEEVTGSPLDRQLFQKCALQRVMQALGAYANITYNQDDSWYEQFMKPGVKVLESLTDQSAFRELFKPIFTTANEQ